MPEIPLLLRQAESKRKDMPIGKDNSMLLDLWRLWLQELDRMEHPAADIQQLTSEAESLEWDPLGDDSVVPPFQSNNDQQLNLELMAKVSDKLKEMQNKFKVELSDDADIVDRLEREAYILSCISN